MFNLVVACLSFGSFFLGLFMVVVASVCNGGLGCGSSGGFEGMEQVVDLDGVG